MDCSNYPENHIMHDNQNSGKLGYLKPETIEPISEFVGLKSKMYAFSFGNEYKKIGKGIKRSCLKNISFNTYINVLETGTFLRHQMPLIVSKMHEINTVFQNKISLSSFYDKKFLETNGLRTRSYGHHENCTEIDSD